MYEITIYKEKPKVGKAVEMNQGVRQEFIIRNNI
jgi:hypothetical protein